jgi:hypothetical protein
MHFVKSGLAGDQLAGDVFLGQGGGLGLVAAALGPAPGFGLLGRSAHHCRGDTLFVGSRFGSAPLLAAAAGKSSISRRRLLLATARFGRGDFVGRARSLRLPSENTFKALTLGTKLDHTKKITAAVNADNARLRSPDIVAAETELAVEGCAAECSTAVDDSRRFGTERDERAMRRNYTKGVRQATPQWEK